MGDKRLDERQLSVDKKMSRVIHFVNMFLIYCAFGLLLLAVSGEETGEEVPSWIIDNPGYKTPQLMDSIAEGKGSIQATGVGNKGWLVSLNQKAGHGVELELEKLILEPDYRDFLMISTWPLWSNFKQVKLFTGKFEKPLNKLHIPNTMKFFVLYSARDASISPEVRINFRRYGRSLEPNQLPTENPAKKKETVHEVQLRGKAPEDYAAPEVLSHVKEAVRAAARRYCAANNISFNEQIPTEEMVLIHKITFCPFEWPDREICASVKHSVFVSGIRIPDEAIILNYQLTADRLKVMWDTDDFPELQQLGITVFHLPPTYSILGYWIVIVVLAIISSLIVTSVVWKLNKTNNASPEQCSAAFEETKKRKGPKWKLPKHQRIPSFMYGNPTYPHDRKLKESALMRATEESIDDLLKPGGPMKSYMGSTIFGPNAAFEDDEDTTVEYRQKGPEQTTPM